MPPISPGDAADGLMPAAGPVGGRPVDRPATVGSVDHALDVLEAVAIGGRGIGVTEIGRRTSLPKSTVFRLLAALSARGYVARGDPPSSYRLGVKAWEVGAAYLSNVSFREAARPVMERLAAETGETVYLTIYADGAAVLVDVTEPPDPVRWAVPIGTRLPAWSTATGKVLLAGQPDEEVERVLAGPRIPESPRAISDPDAIRAAIEAARRDGYSINRRGWHADVAGAAVPIQDHLGRTVAALGAAGPADRFLAKVDRALARLIEGAREISGQLGHRD